MRTIVGGSLFRGAPVNHGEGGLDKREEGRGGQAVVWGGGGSDERNGQKVWAYMEKKNKSEMFMFVKWRDQVGN